jgi:spoIIIJ-associated protein
MLTAEGTGKSIEKAIENALLELKAKREDVDIKILEEGGLFKKAKVLVTISEDSKAQYEKKAKKVDDEEIEKLDIKAMFADLKNEPKEEKKEVKKEEKTETVIKPKEKVQNTNKEKFTGKDFIKGLLKKLNIEANVFVEENEETINILVEGGNAGDLIGYRGECLNAIQYVASIVENENSTSRKRLVLDIEKYRSRREESLKGLAHRMEKKVLKTNKSIKLEPMSANERRIIHTELQQSDKVTTISKGTEPNRFIIVVPKRDQQNTNKIDEMENEEE